MPSSSIVEGPRKQGFNSATWLYVFFWKTRVEMLMAMSTLGPFRPFGPRVCGLPELPEHGNPKIPTSLRLLLMNSAV